jgi:hypothetical protein
VRNRTLNMVDCRVPVVLKALRVAGASEKDIVYSGLEETMTQVLVCVWERRL